MLSCTTFLLLSGIVGVQYLPRRSPMTREFAPNTSTLKMMLSSYGLIEEGRPSFGIRLTAPIPKLTNVTPRDDSINLFSKESRIGRL